MQETTLMKIALSCIVLGLPALYVLSDTFDLSYRILDRIGGIHKADDTTITGTVISIEEDETTKIVLRQLTTVIIPDSIHAPVNSTIRAKGKLEQNGNRSQLIAHEIRVI